MSKKIVFVINHAAFFVSHRLPVALAARDEGYEVYLIIGQGGSNLMEPLAEAELRRVGIPFIRTAFRAAGTNPVWECLGFAQVLWQLLKLKPQIVHTASPKASIYGGLASRLLRVPKVVVAVSGMGFLFTGTSRGIKQLIARAYQTLLTFVYRHPNLTVIVQNHDDRSAVIESFGVSADKTVLIPGSGVRLSDYAASCGIAGEDVVVLPARLLKDKGVEEFVSAARVLKAQGFKWRFALVGTADYSNPTSIAEKTIRAWEREGVIEWWGHRDDMPEVYAQADLVCLPSYREGMPKCLLEAAAAGRAVVTTDVTGCREAIVPRETGELVPVKNADALALTLAKLMNDSALRRRYGAAGRKLAEYRFSIRAVIETTLDLYRQSTHCAKADALARATEPGSFSVPMNCDDCANKSSTNDGISMEDPVFLEKYRENVRVI